MAKRNSDNLKWTGVALSCCPRNLVCFEKLIKNILMNSDRNFH